MDVNLHDFLVIALWQISTEILDCVLYPMLGQDHISENPPRAAISALWMS